jgi:hypothetical protein
MVVAIRFRVAPTNSKNVADVSAPISIYSVKLVAPAAAALQLELAVPPARARAKLSHQSRLPAKPNERLTPIGVTVKSRYLGTVYYDLFGRYSPCGFFDSVLQRWRVWAGGGIPEAPACDNVWYSELALSELPPTDVAAEVLPPRRCALNASNLYPAEGPQKGYGGDPTVVRAASASSSDATTIAMYFSGLELGRSWNQIYRAVSLDGVQWRADPREAVVPAATGGVAGYGTGSPSAVWMNGTLHLWYYSQSEAAGPGMYLRTSTDGGRTFPNQTLIKCSIDQVMDVKWISALGVFAGTFYDQKSRGCDRESGVSVGLSADGVEWVVMPSTAALPTNFSQGFTACLNSNPGWIGGDEYGHASTSLMVAYGASVTEFGLWEYYSRQLVYSSVQLSRSG